MRYQRSSRLHADICLAGAIAGSGHAPAFGDNDIIMEEADQPSHNNIEQMSVEGHVGHAIIEQTQNGLMMNPHPDILGGAQNVAVGTGSNDGPHGGPHQIQQFGNTDGNIQQLVTDPLAQFNVTGVGSTDGPHGGSHQLQHLENANENVQQLITAPLEQLNAAAGEIGNATANGDAVQHSGDAVQPHANGTLAALNAQLAQTGYEIAAVYAITDQGPLPINIFPQGADVVFVPNGGGIFHHPEFPRTHPMAVFLRPYINSEPIRQRIQFPLANLDDSIEVSSFENSSCGL